MSDTFDHDPPINPFAAPTTDAGRDHFADEQPGDVLAARGSRLGAAMIDGVVMMAILVPIQIFSGFTGRAMAQQVGVMEQFAMSLVGMIVYLIPNGYFLATRGQSLGKMILGIQIVDVETNELLPFVRLYVYRYLWILPVVILVILIPGSLDDALIQLVTIVDSLMIFRSDKRCLHDLIAGTKVVQYKFRN